MYGGLMKWDEKFVPNELNIWSSSPEFRDAAVAVSIHLEKKYGRGVDIPYFNDKIAVDVDHVIAEIEEYYATR